MKEIQWDRCMSVGIVSIDKEHNRLVSLMNCIAKEVVSGKPLDFDFVLLELENYCKEHFQHEERLFEQFNFSDKAHHIGEHRAFMETFEKIKRDLGQPGSQKLNPPDSQKENGQKENGQKEGGQKENGQKESGPAPRLKITKEGNLLVASSIARYLFDWLINHIMKEDKKYIELFKKNGVI